MIRAQSLHVLAPHLAASVDDRIRRAIARILPGGSERTATPLQALVLLNDPQYVEAARVLAEQLIRQQSDSVPARTAVAFRLLTSRQPTPRELEVLLARI